MPDMDGPDKKTPNEAPGDTPEGRRFMREKIVKQPMSKRQIAKRALAFLFVAVLFGVIAAVSFVVTRPIAGRFLETTEESTPIMFTKDELETTVPPSTEEDTEPETVETEPVEEYLKSAVGKYQFNSSDFDAMYSVIHEIGQDVDKGIVTVHSAKQQTDWFGNPVEQTGQFAGGVIAKANGELLILTFEAAVEDADSIRVTFSDGTVTGGTIKQTDHILGMAVVTVNAKDIPAQTYDKITVLTLGNSYSVQQGDMVIGVGSPAGIIHSTTYGTIAYVARNIQAVDSVTRVFYSDIVSNAQTGTFFSDTSGQIIGWATDGYKNDSNQNMTAIYSISDYKGILEKLTNGISAPYLGIQGQEVAASMLEQGLPQGVYVINAISGSPAYDAGIQNGDILIRVGDKEIVTVKDLQTKVESMSSGEDVTVVVARKGRDEYKELEFQVNVRAR